MKWIMNMAILLACFDPCTAQISTRYVYATGGRSNTVSRSSRVFQNCQGNKMQVEATWQEGTYIQYMIEMGRHD